MIISHGRRYVFVHIPKTGGTSMALALEARAMKDDILIGDTPKAVRRRKRLAGMTAAGRVWKHSQLGDVFGLLSEAEMADYFVFTLVRNPWDRIVSYYHWLREQRFAHPAVELAKVTEFSAFLNNAGTQATLHSESFGAYVLAPSGENMCDAFVRLEHLKEDLQAVEAHLGFSLHPLPRTNASNRAKDYRDVYSDRDAALVAKLCAEDITRFGYAF